MKAPPLAPKARFGNCWHQGIDRERLAVASAASLANDRAHGGVPPGRLLVAIKKSDRQEKILTI
jgi:hypothetical protein